VRKNGYINYGMEVLKWKRLHCQNLRYQTIYISGGKKNKLNKIDIVGFFSLRRKTRKGDLGLIEVKDFISLRQ
jgi:hypothetical protein